MQSPMQSPIQARIRQKRKVLYSDPDLFTTEDEEEAVAAIKALQQTYKRSSFYLSTTPRKRSTLYVAKLKLKNIGSFTIPISEEIITQVKNRLKNDIEDFLPKIYESPQAKN